MSTTVFPVLHSSSWKMTRTSRWSTQVEGASSGNRTRNPLQGHALYKWTLKNGVLQSAPSVADLQAIQDLYTAMYGRFDFFLWRDPEGASIEDPSVQINVLGLYYWPVAFTQDAVDFDRFAYQLWTCGTLEFEQVGMSTLALAQLQQPHGPVTSATLSILTSHIQGTGYTGTAGATTGIIGTLYGPGFLSDSSAWTLRTDSTSVDPADLSELHVLFAITGSLFGTASPPDQFRIYAAWVDVIYSDTTTARLNPQVYATALSGGTITNPANAVDGDNATFALISRDSFAPLLTPSVLAVNTFV